MRAVKRKFLGEEHTLCFSSRVYCNALDRFGSLDEMFKAMTQDGSVGLSAMYWLLAQCLAAGAKYAERTEGRTERIYSEDDLFDLCGADETVELGDLLLAVITLGTDREQEAEPPKNPVATAPSL